MSFILSRTFNRVVGFTARSINSRKLLKQIQTTIGKHSAAQFSGQSGDSDDFDEYFKKVNSKSRIEPEGNYLGIECAPNWEILAPEGNRFFLPNSVGPAWQSDATTTILEEPLDSIVNFEQNEDNSKLKFKVGDCPSLLKTYLHELFPESDVLNSSRLSFITLSFDGENERGARLFVLAAREIVNRLRLHDYWADFMNPFSGKPFYSWLNNDDLFKLESRFRGTNMQIVKENDCTVICYSETDNTFSGIIYTNAPADHMEIRTLLNQQVFY